LNDNKISGAKNVLLLIVSGTNEITIDEIGEINDHIQSEAGFNANIIMGVGEDETLGENISVTIIATGFNADQQNGIVNSQPSKIIHSLEDEQRLVRDLSQKPVEVFTNIVDVPVVEKEEKIVFELIEEETVESYASVETTSQINENELIAMNEFIKNLDVTFEIVSPIKDIDFKITTPQTREIEVVEAKTVLEKEEEQITFVFDVPSVAQTENENKIVFELTDDTKNIQVNEAVQFVPVTEVNEGGVIKYSLEEYMELENDLLSSKPAAKVEEPVAEELNITMKQTEVEKPLSTPFASNFEDVSPIEMTIEETLKMRADERRRKLKEFNYKFHNNASRIDEMEKEPAYKRLGVDLSNENNANPNSRMSLGIDSNNDVQLRSNNSFLHDNVD
jgi:cell division protein FtsZ